jgi:regulator of nonsense transcripts 2
MPHVDESDPQCNPPERVVREVVEMPPMQSWIQHLLHNVLTKRSLDKVLKYLRKLHWEEEEVCCSRTKWQMT